MLMMCDDDDEDDGERDPEVLRDNCAPTRIKHGHCRLRVWVLDQRWIRVPMLVRALDGKDRSLSKPRTQAG